MLLSINLLLTRYGQHVSFVLVFLHSVSLLINELYCYCMIITIAMSKHNFYSYLILYITHTHNSYTCIKKCQIPTILKMYSHIILPCIKHTQSQYHTQSHNTTTQLHTKYLHVKALTLSNMHTSVPIQTNYTKKIPVHFNKYKRTCIILPCGSY